MSRLRDTGIFVGSLAVLIVALATGARTLFTKQAAIARQRIGKPLGETSINADKTWRKGQQGAPIRLLILGDSLAAGLGAEHRKETLGARIAKSLARELKRPVKLRTAAVVGSESSALAEQLDTLPPQYRADVAVIVVGGNDVTHLVPTERAAGWLQQAIRRLHEQGTPVVVGTCPDLGSLRPVPQPLRTVLSLMSRRMAAAQTAAARREGAIPVNLRRAVGPMFKADPGEMFSIDQFHPSATGYRRTAQALLPAVVEALQVQTSVQRCASQ